MKQSEKPFFTKSEEISFVTIEEIKRLDQYKKELINLATYEPPRHKQRKPEEEMHKKSKKPNQRNIRLINMLFNEANEIDKYITYKLLKHENLLNLKNC